MPSKPNHLASFAPILLLLHCCSAVQHRTPQYLGNKQRNPVTIRAQTCSRFNANFSSGRNKIVLMAQHPQLLPASCDLGQSIKITTGFAPNGDWTEICSPSKGHRDRVKHFKGPQEDSMGTANFTVRIYYTYMTTLTLYSECKSDFDAWLSVEHYGSTFKSNCGNVKPIDNGAPRLLLWAGIPLAVSLVWCVCRNRSSQTLLHQVQPVENESPEQPVEMASIEIEDKPQSPFATPPDPLSDKHAFLKM